MGGEAGGETGLGDERGSNGCEGWSWIVQGGRSLEFCSGGCGVYLFQCGNVHLVIGNNVVCEFAAVRGTKRRQVLDRRLLLEHFGTGTVTVPRGIRDGVVEGGIGLLPADSPEESTEI